MASESISEGLISIKILESMPPEPPSMLTSHATWSRRPSLPISPLVNICGKLPSAMGTHREDTEMASESI